MSCSSDTVRCQYTSSCCHQNLLIILNALEDLFQEHNLRHWIAFGTLLGALRTGHFIPWDEDVDMGILEEDFPKLLDLIPKIVEKGFATNNSVVIDCNHVEWNRVTAGFDVSQRKIIPLGLSIFLSKINSLHVDIFPYGHDDIKTWCWYAPTCVQPLQNVLNLSKIVFEGREFPCPSNPEEGIRAYYGDDWQIPKVRNWVGKRIKDPQLLEEMQRLDWYGT